jgi:hypothetical protein
VAPLFCLAPAHCIRQNTLFHNNNDDDKKRKDGRRGGGKRVHERRARVAQVSEEATARTGLFSISILYVFFFSLDSNNFGGEDRIRMRVLLSD